MGMGVGIAPPNVFLVQVWDAEQKRAVKLFLPSPWPLDLYAGYQVLDRVEMVGRSLLEWAASECPLAGPLQPKPDHSDEIRIRDLGAGGNRWFDRATRTLARLGLRSPIVDQLVAATFLGSTGRVATTTDGGMMQIWQLR